MDSAFGLIRSPHAILFGAGQRHALGASAAALGKRALVCTDARLAADPGFGQLMDQLQAAGVAVQVYADAQPELPIAGLHDCVAAAAPFGPDLVVGIGGGSCMDMAKLASLLLAHGGRLDDYYGELRVPGPIVPVIAMPTTAGTGSEVTPVAVVADSQRDLKVGVSSPFLIPHTAICDPELTLTCPPLLTAYAGADALTHAIEAFTAIRREATPALALERVFVGKNSLSDVHALLAIRQLAAHLPRAVSDGSDLAARAGVMAGALHAGLAFGTAGTAAAHAIQYPVGALTHTAHAAGVAVLMPYVMAYNRPVCTAEFAAIADAMGLRGDDPAALADAAIGAVAGLLARIGIPSSLRELGVTAGQIGSIAEQSMLAARLIHNNPRPLDPSAIRGIVEAALTGERG